MLNSISKIYKFVIIVDLPTKMLIKHVTEYLLLLLNEKYHEY